MFTSWNQTDTHETSYFNFLMTNRGLRRTAVPFAQAVGVLPDLTRRVRVAPCDVRTAPNAARAFRAKS